MTTAQPPRSARAAALLSLALFGCGGSGAEGAGAGGAAPDGGAGGLGGAGASVATGGDLGAGGGVTGGVSAVGGQPASPVTGGSPGDGGVTAAGGSSGGAAPTGGSLGVGGAPSPSGGQAGGPWVPDPAGGASVGGAQADTGGLGGAAIGGNEAAGGSAGTGGPADTGGQAGDGTGGSEPSGGTTGDGGASGGTERLISFGTLRDPQAAMSAAQALAASVADPTSAQWQAKGDQHRTYPFAEANADEPYRLYVPTTWDGQSELPLVMFLHGAGSNENTYVDQNGQQLIQLAQEHGFLLVSPLGAQGAYGNFLRLTAPFGDEAGAAELMAQVTPESELANQLSEQDVINVLELVLAEYPVDRGAMFLAGHSMGSGGTWYIGGKYAEYWTALAPLSGPFVQESGYPWDELRETAIFVTEGTQTPSLDASRLLRDWLSEHGFLAEYEEVNADHGGMVPLVLPDVFDFFERSRAP
jgi:predicted esterase